MVSLTQQTEDGFGKVVLSTENLSVEVVPDCGAMLHAMTLDTGDELVNVVGNYASREDFQNNYASKGYKSAKMAPFVCRINEGKYSFEGKDYRIEGGYLGPHSIHGLIYKAPFVVTDSTEHEDYARVNMEYQYNGEDPGYPFGFTCQVEYKLTDENRLYLSTSITNNSTVSIPFADGWHPYFTFNKKIDELQLEFQTQTQLEFDAGMIPTGKEEAYEAFTAIKPIGQAEFDDCFRLNFDACQPLVVLRDPEKHLQLEILPGKSYPFIQIYTPPDRQSIAIENLSAAPDSFNNKIGLTVIEAGESVSFETSYLLKKL